MQVDAEQVFRDRDLSIVAARVACESLRRDLANEQEEIKVIDREFHESLSYRIGSMLCPYSLL